MANFECAVLISNGHISQDGLGVSVSTWHALGMLETVLELFAFVDPCSLVLGLDLVLLGVIPALVLVENNAHLVFVVLALGVLLALESTEKETYSLRKVVVALGVVLPSIVLAKTNPLSFFGSLFLPSNHWLVT